jgi:hypothetical protein
MKNNIFAVVLLLTLPVLPNIIIANETISELSIDELKFIATSMKTVEDSLLNVRIDSNAWMEQGPSSSGPWEQTPICWSTTAFLGDISTNRARIDFLKEVVPWINGAAPYLEQQYSVSFDGLIGRRKDISISYNGSIYKKNNGEILSEEPLQLEMCDRITGIGASLFFYYRNMPAPFPKRISVNFEAAADPNSFLSALASADPNYLNFKPNVNGKIVIEELEGIQCIKITCISGSLIQEWWLDPNRGFAILKFENLRKDRDSKLQVKSSINVTKLKEVAKDIWWPMEAYFINNYHETDKPWKRIFYQASNVIVNDPNFDNNVFAIDFPKGYNVDDTINRKNYIVDSNLNMIAEPNYSPHFKTIRKPDGG